MSTADVFAIYGASGFGREVMPLARAQLARQGVPAECLLFVDDAPPAATVNGQACVSFAEFLARPAARRHVAIAIANGQVRARLVARCGEHGILPWSVSADNVCTMDEVSLGEGAILSPFVTLTSNIRIGRYFHANLYSYVAHDCDIGDFVTFAPGVKCNGNIRIEDYAYIGTGAVLKQGLPGMPLVIGRGAVVGMGAVVTKSVAPGSVVVGNPAHLHSHA